MRHNPFIYGIYGIDGFFYSLCVAFGHKVRFAVPHVDNFCFKCHIRTQEVSALQGQFERSALFLTLEIIDLAMAIGVVNL